jgi:hypothetical protein
VGNRCTSVDGGNGLIDGARRGMLGWAFPFVRGRPMSIEFQLTPL